MPEKKEISNQLLVVFRTLKGELSTLLPKDEVGVVNGILEKLIIGIEKEGENIYECNLNFKKLIECSASIRTRLCQLLESFCYSKPPGEPVGPIKGYILPEGVNIGVTFYKYTMKPLQYVIEVVENIENA